MEVRNTRCSVSLTLVKVIGAVQKQRSGQGEAKVTGWVMSWWPKVHPSWPWVSRAPRMGLHISGVFDEGQVGYLPLPSTRLQGTLI